MLAEENRAETLAKAGLLRSALVSDSLDKLGIESHSMSAEIAPISAGFRIAGFARTLHYVPARRTPGWEARAFEVELAAIDSLEPGDIVVASTIEACLWGELLSTASTVRGAVGAVVDGHTRDVDDIIALEFPVFARGSHPNDSLGRAQAVSSDTPIACGGVQVRPGDLVIGDTDGVVVIPSELTELALAEAEAKSATEGVVRDAIRAGQSLRLLYQEHGVL